MSRDQKFFDMYTLVIGVLVAIALGIYVLASNMSDRTQGVYKRDGAEYQAAVAERIRPVGQVRLPGDSEPVEAPATGEPAIEEPTAAMAGPDVYSQACAVCHGTGVGGAPMLGNKEQWAGRIAQGTDVLTQHAIGGFTGALGLMPPKGGRMDLSDEEVANAVQYMVDEAS